jgi:hypothetical protein
MPSLYHNPPDQGSAAAIKREAMSRRDQPTRYHAYVLRCWEEQGYTVGQAGRWRFSLEHINTQTRRGFASMEALVAFLGAELSSKRDQTKENDR